MPHLAVDIAGWLLQRSDTVILDEGKFSLTSVRRLSGRRVEEGELPPSRLSGGGKQALLYSS